MEQTPVQLTPEEIASAQPVDQQPVQLTPEELASAKPVDQQPVDALKDFTTDQLVALQKQDPTFRLADQFRARPDIRKDPNRVQVIADALHQSRQTPLFEGLAQKYQGDSGVGTAWNVAKAGLGVAEDVVKGFGKQIWNYAQAAATPVGAMVTAPFTDPETTARMLDLGQRQVVENIAGSELASTATAKLAKETAAFFGRKAHIVKPLADYTPEERVAALFDEVAALDQNEEISKGKGAILSAVGSHVVQDLHDNGVAVRPDEVAELAAGDPFSWYAMGGAFHAANALVPKAAANLAARGAEKLGEFSTKAVGKGIETGADLTKMAAKFSSKVAPAAGAVIGATKGGGISGVLAGMKAGELAAETLSKTAATAERVSQFGEQISGAKPIVSPGGGAQLVKDLITGAPGAALELGKGAAFDLGLAAVTSEESPEDRAGVGLGTVFGGLGAAKSLGLRTLSGQILAPRDFGAPGNVKSSGAFPAMDAMHNAAIKKADPGTAAQVNAMRAFAKGAGSDVFYGETPKEMEDALLKTGVSPEQAKLLSEQEGFFSANVNGKRIIGVRNPSAAPHESFHAFQDVLGEAANQEIDKIIYSKFAPQWEREGARYASRLLSPLGREVTDWRENVLDESHWGAAQAAEKISQNVFNKLSAETGATPSPEAVKDLASGEWNRVLAEAAKRNPNASLGDIQKQAWRDVLTPQEADGVANKYLARELAAENFDAIFKGTAGSLEYKGALPKLASIVARVVSFMGGEPLAGRVSEIGHQPLSFDVVEAVRKAAKGEKPEITPPSGPGTLTPRAGIPVTPQAQQEAANEAQAHAQEASDQKPAPTPQVPNPQSPREVLGTVAEAIANRGGVKINYHSAPDEPAAAITSKRDVRRAIIEAYRTMPKAARALWEKTFFPERVVKQGEKLQVMGWAPEVFASNAHKVAQTLNEIESKKPGSFQSPYELDPKTGSFSEAGWKALYEDVQTFVQNQIGGRTGAGEKLVVPKDVPGTYQPLTSGTPQPLDQAKADFINLLFNFKLPDTGRTKAGEFPRNLAGQQISEATQPGRVEVPTRPRPPFSGKAAEKMGIEGKPILEVNPARNALEKAAIDAGVQLPSMVEAIQRLNVDNIADIQHAPEAPEFRGNTLTLTAGFQPSKDPRAIKAAAVKEKRTGKIFEGGAHFLAQFKADEAGASPYSKENYTDGFTTNSGEFLTRNQAYARAVELRQLEPGSQIAVGDELHAGDVQFQAQPTGAAAMERLQQMKPEELRDYKGKLANGGTGWAFDVGSAARTPDDLQAFRAARETFNDLRKDAMAKGDFAKAIDYGTRGQFAREAFEAATGKQIDDPTKDAGNFGLPENYQPPVQLQPTREAVNDIFDEAFRTLKNTPDYQKFVGVEGAYKNPRNFLISLLRALKNEGNPARPGSEAQYNKKFEAIFKAHAPQAYRMIQQRVPTMEIADRLNEVETSEGRPAQFQPVRTAVEELFKDALRDMERRQSPAFDVYFNRYPIQWLDNPTLLFKKLVTAIRTEENPNYVTVDNQGSWPASRNEIEFGKLMKTEDPQVYNMIKQRLPTMEIADRLNEVETSEGRPVQFQPPKTQELRRESWLDRSGRVISAPGGHFEAAKELLPNEKWQYPEDMYAAMYSRGYQRLAKFGDTLHVNGPDITPSQRRTLTQLAEDHNYKIANSQGSLIDIAAQLQPNAAVTKVAEDYSKESGIPYRPLGAAKPVNPALAKRLADFYDEAVHSPDDPKVKASYDALAKETVDQWNAIKAAGYTLEPWTEGGEPYADSKAMIADVQDNKHLFFKPTEGDITGDNLMLAPSGIEGLSVNDVFRAVHDFFGHAKEGLSFGPKGEFNAWRAHSGMYSDEAQGALAAETLAQNSWVNFGAHLRNESGEIPEKGEAGYRGLTERPFAAQKNVVIPKSIISEAQFQPKTAAGRALEEKGYTIEREDVGTGRRDYFVKDPKGNIVADLRSSQISPTSARVEMVHTRIPYRKQGFAETLYRELATDLQKAGVTELTGFVIDSGARRIREKVFNDKYAGGPSASEISPTAQYQPGILGTVNDEFKVRSREVKALDEEEHGDFGFRNNPKTGDFAWRYRPDNKTLYWWEKPENETARDEVVNHLADKGHEVAAQKEIFPSYMDRPSSQLYAEAHGEATQLQPKKEDWKLKTGAAGFSKAWILPTGQPVQLGGQWHHDYLNENEALRKEYGLKETDNADVARAAALKKGFARINYDVRNGKMTIEAREQDWPNLAPSIQKLIEENLGKVDRVQVYQYDKGVNKIVDSGTGQLFDKPDKDAKLAAVPFLQAPGDVTETSPQATPGALQFQPPPPKELKKIRDGESPGQTFTAAGKIWDPKGAAVDIVSLASVNVPQEDLTPSAFKQAVAPYQRLLKKPGIVAGVFAFDKDGKPTVSIDINAVVPQEHRENTVAFAKANDQNSIWDAKANELVPTGGAGNTKLKEPGELSAAAEALQSGQPYDFENRSKKSLANPEIAQMSKDELADYYPESVIAKKKDEYIPSKIKESPLFKEAANEDEAVQKFSDKLVEFANRYKNSPNFELGAKWYSEFSKQLHKEFGDLAGIFAEFLAATSPQTGVATNFHYAFEALQSLKAGRFDKILPKFEEGLQMIQDGTWEKWYQDQIKSGAVTKPPVKPTAATFLAQWVEHFGLRPLQTNGKQFGMHSGRVLQVLARKWEAMNTGPKTRTFVSNLIGSAHDATIDIWADRTMRRLGYEGAQQRWRILPNNAAPVSEADFAFSQKAFAKAAEELGMKPDALQGALWFAEKQLWSDNGWGKLDLGSFMNEIPKMPAMKEGFKQRLETPAGKLIEPRNLKEAPVMERGYTVPGKTAFEEEI